jgi:hypothetical protein
MSTLLYGFTEEQISKAATEEGIDLDKVFAKDEVAGAAIIARLTIRLKVEQTLEENSSRCCDDATDRRALANALADMFFAMASG